MLEVAISVKTMLVLMAKVPLLLMGPKSMKKATEDLGGTSLEDAVMRENVNGKLSPQYVELTQF
jgi:hypothetical protein